MPVSATGQTDRVPEPLRRFVSELTAEHRLLLVLRTRLYDGDWGPMIADLRNRLAGKPHVFRLAARIEDDLQRIQQLTSIEQQYQVNLSHLIGADAENPELEARA